MLRFLLSAFENRILDNKEIAKLQPKKTHKELLRVPVAPPVNVELMCEVFARLRHCGPRYCNVIQLHPNRRMDGYAGPQSSPKILCLAPSSTLW